MLTALNKEIAHMWNAGMVEFQKELGLALKPIDGLAAVDIAVEIVQHFFDCARFVIKTCIYSPIHCSHTPSSNRLFNFVSPRRKHSASRQATQTTTVVTRSRCLRRWLLL